MQTKTPFLSHFLNDRICRGIWFSPENMASTFCLVFQSFISSQCFKWFWSYKKWEEEEGGGGRGGCTTIYIYA